MMDAKISSKKVVHLKTMKINQKIHVCARKYNSVSMEYSYDCCENEALYLS